MRRSNKEDDVSVKIIEDQDNDKQQIKIITYLHYISTILLIINRIFIYRYNLDKWLKRIMISKIKKQSNQS